EHVADADMREEVIDLEPIGQRRQRASHVARAFLQQRYALDGVEREERRQDAAAQRRRKRVVPLEHLLLRVARVAAEELVAAVSGEQLLDSVAARAARADERRDGRRVAERLVVVRR